jgi:hypothetical protein
MRKGVLMKKLLASALAAGILIAGMATAQTMPVARFQSLKSRQPILISDLVSSECRNSADQCATPTGRRRLRSVAHDFPYMPSRFNVSGYDAGEGRFCGFGSYVACAYAGTYCWRRCY